MEALKQALLALTDEVYNFVAPPNHAVPYIIWQREGDNDFLAGNRHSEFCETGSVDLFTMDAKDPLITGIANALTDMEAAWYLNSKQYEEETGLYHYEWVVEVL